MARPYSYTFLAGFASSPEDPVDAQVWTDLSQRVAVQGGAGARISFGRPDEFGEVVPSSLALTLNNSDGALTPLRPASPYFPNVVTGKRVRFGLLYLSPGHAQLIPDDASFEGAGPFGWSSRDGLAVTTIGQTTAFAQNGAASMLLTLPTAAAGQAAVRKVYYGLVAGRTYTASVYLRVPTGSPAVLFAVSPGGSIATTVTNAFQRRAVTFVATGSTYELSITTNGASTAGQLVQVDALQIEEGVSATAFDSFTSVFFWRFTGDVTQWPLRWSGGPAFYAESNFAAVDRIKRLDESGEFRPLLQETILQAGPQVYYPLQEEAASVTAGDVSGTDETPLSIAQVGTLGELRLGESPGSENYWDTDTTTAGFNPAGAGNGKYLKAQFKALTSTAATGATVTAMAQESPLGVLTTGPMAIVTASDGSWFGVTKVGSGNVTASFYSASTGTRYDVVSGIGFSTTKSTLYAAVLDMPSGGTGRITFYATNGAAFGTPVTFPLALAPAWSQFSVGGQGKELFRGNIAHATLFTRPLSSSEINDQHQAAFRGFSGSTNVAYSRLNKLAGWAGLGTVQYFTNGGPYAPQQLGPQEIEGNPKAALQRIVDSEDGLFFIGGDGAARFYLRNSRFNADPVITIAADRLDPQAISFRGDDFGLQNDITAKKADGAEVRVVNDTSRIMVGRRKDSIDTVLSTDQAARQLAAWKANTNGVPRNRVTGVKISLLNDPGLIRLALFLTPGRLIMITGLPGQAPSSTLDLFVEGWEEVISEEEWSMTLNTSPGEVGDVWAIGVAGRSEIGVTTRIAY